MYVVFPANFGFLLQKNNQVKCAENQTQKNLILNNIQLNFFAPLENQNKLLSSEGRGKPGDF